MKKAVFILLTIFWIPCHAQDSINLESVFAAHHCKWLTRIDEALPSGFHLALLRNKNNQNILEYLNPYGPASRANPRGDDIILWQNQYVIEGPGFLIKDQPDGEKIREVTVNLNELCAKSDWKQPFSPEFVASIQGQAYEEYKHYFKKKEPITTLLMEDIYIGIRSFYFYDPETEALIKTTITYANSTPNKADVYFDHEFCRDANRCPGVLTAIDRLRQKKSQSHVTPFIKPAPLIIEQTK